MIAELIMVRGVVILSKHDLAAVKVAPSLSRWYLVSILKELSTIQLHDW